MIEFGKIPDFPRGTLYGILADAYSFDERNRRIWDANWKETDAFFYDHPEIADKYGFVTCLDKEPIGFVTWDPRHRPEYVEIGHNGIREQYKGRGYGRLQLEEALRRIDMQMSDDEYCSLGDYSIDNSWDMESLNDKVGSLIKDQLHSRGIRI